MVPESSRASSALRLQAERAIESDLKQVRQYLDDPDVQEVMINDPDNVFIERKGQFVKIDGLSFSAGKIEALVNTLAGLNGKSVTPVIDCRLPGLRIAATLPPIAVKGPSLCIRRHSSKIYSLSDYEGQGAFRAADIAAADRDEFEHDISKGGPIVGKFLEWLLQSKKNFVVSGSTSSGKTAFLNALAQHIPMDDRVITIEDTAELQIPVPNWLSFEANKDKGISVRALVKHALRNRPNRIWVGEGRGEEFYDILDAYNTGHPGSTVTFHSNSASMALTRLENMVRMAPEATNWPLPDLRKQIASTFSYVIHCSNVASARGPSSIMAIDGCEDGRYITRTLFRRGYD